MRELVSCGSRCPVSRRVMERARIPGSLPLEISRGVLASIPPLRSTHPLRFKKAVARLPSRGAVAAAVIGGGTPNTAPRAAAAALSGARTGRRRERRGASPQHRDSASSTARSDIGHVDYASGAAAMAANEKGVNFTPSAYDGRQ